MSFTTLKWVVKILGGAHPPENPPRLGVDRLTFEGKSGRFKKCKQKNMLQKRKIL